MAFNLSKIYEEEEEKKRKQQQQIMDQNYYTDSNGFYLRRDANPMKLHEAVKQGQSQLNEKAREIEKARQAEEESSGYHFGDVTKGLINFGGNVLATGTDLALDILEGGLSYAEGGIDTLAYLGADALDIVGAGDLASDLRSRADFNSTAQIFGKNPNVQQNFGNWTQGIEEASWSPDFVDQIAQGIGQIGTAGLTAAATGGGSLASAGVTFASSYGNARSEAKRNGASDADAHRAGLIGGFAETISEQFFDAIPGMKVEGWGSKLTGKIADKVTKYFGTKTGKIALKAMDSLGEGSEEIISNILNAALTDIGHAINNEYTYGMENMSGNILEDTWDQLWSSDSWGQFLSAALSSAIVNGGKAVFDTKTQNMIINAYAQDNGMSFADAKYILTGEETLKDIKEEINRDKTEYNSQVELEEMAKQRALNYAQQNNTDNINEQINAMEKANGEKFSDEDRQKLFESFKNRTEDEINSPERYRTLTLKEAPKDERNKNFYESAQRVGMLDTKEAHNLYNFFTKLHEVNPNSQYEMTSNEDLVDRGILQKREVMKDGKPETEYGIYVTKNGKQEFNKVTANGLKVDGKVLINKDGKNAMEQTTWHEVAHFIKDSSPDGYKELRNIVREVFGEDDFEKSKPYYESLYGENQQDLEDEYINDKLGELLNNEKFYKRVTENKNLLERIIDKLKEMVKYVTSNTEQRNLMKIQQKLEDTYMELYKGTKFERSQDAQYSLFSMFKKAEKDNSRLFVVSDELRNEIEDKTKKRFSKNKDVKFMNIKNILTGENNGGFRNTQQIEDLVNGIKKNGITEAIEVFTNNNGDIQIYDGNHRYEVAKNIGIEKVPVTFVDNFIDNSVNEEYNSSKEGIINEEYGSDRQGTEGINSYNENIRDQQENGNKNINDIKNIKPGQENAELYNGIQGYNNRPSSISKNGQDSNKGELESSFNLPKYSLTRATDEQIKEAVDLEKKGESAEEIYLDTGAYRGADGLWRSEIDDSGARIKLDKPYTYNMTSFRLEDILDHPKLYEAYPEFKDLEVVIGDLPETYNGFVDEMGTIYIDNILYDKNQYTLETLEKRYKDLTSTEAGKEIGKLLYGDQYDNELKRLEEEISNYDYRNYQTDFKSTLLHEIQHKIQDKEGFARGSNTGDRQAQHDKYMENIREFNQELSELYEKSGIGTQWVEENMPRVLSGEITMDEFFAEQKEARLKSPVGSLIRQKLEDKEDYEYRYGVYERDAFDLYQNTAGEIEAREVQKRMNMSPGERQANLPFIKDEKTIFAEPTLNRKYGVVKDSDVRYSLSADSQGRELSKEQQEYFKDSKVRDNEGRLLEVYHGTPNGQFFEFNKNYLGGTSLADDAKLGFHFTDNKVLADYFSKDLTDDPEVDKPVVMSQYLNIKKPLSYFADYGISEEQLANDLVYISTGENDVTNVTDTYENNMEVLSALQQNFDNARQEMKDLLATPEAMERIKELGYDGLILPMADADAKTILQSGNEYIIFDSNQTKNTDNTNPTSNPDIRYSLSQTGEMVDNNTGEKVTFDVQPVETSLPTNKTLMAIHNLNESKLNGVLDLGGFPVPSIAITNPNIVNHKQFGDISVIFDKETINPENRLNEVFDRDVWSPTFPTIEYDLNTKTIDRVRKAIGGYGNNYLSSANSTMNNIEDKINRYGVEDTIKDLKDDNNFKYIYYKTMNPDFELLTKEETEDLNTDYSNRMLQEFADEYGEIPKWTEATDEQRKDIVDKFGQKLIPFLEERAKTIIDEEMAKPNPRQFIISIAKSNVDHIKERMGALGWQDKLLENLNRIQKEGTTRIVNDYKATSDFINENINQQEYEKWIDDLFSDIVNKKGIYNGKEIFTASGNRRTFNQLHEDYNLQNLVKILTNQDTIAGEQGFGAGQGFGTIQAKQSNRFNSIQDIKDAESRITSNSNEVVDQLREVIGQDMEQLNDYQKIKSEYSYVDSAGTALNDFAAYKNLTMNNLNTALENNNINSKNVPMELKQKIIDDIESLKTIPTDYFEAKPQRAVGLDEIGAVVIPSNVSEELKQRLRDNNIDFTEYNPEIEGDRNAKINEYQQYIFSLSQEAPQRGYGTYTEDITNNIINRNLPLADDLRQDLEETYGTLTEEDYKNKKRELIDKYVDRAASKIEEQVKEVARRNLALKNKDIADLRNIIGAYYEMSREDIYSSDAKDVLRQFVEDHSHQEYEEQLINDEIRDMQKDIRAREFIISSDYKEEFPDGLTKFKKNNPGINIKFGAKGNLDTQLQELADLYPGQIDANVTYGDIPYVLADLMKKEYKQTKMQEFNLNEEEIDNITNKMFYGLTNNAISDQDLDRYVTDIQDKIRNKYARQMAIKNYRQEAKEMLDEIGLSNIKDKKRGLLYQVNTMKRNLRDIMNKESADKMYNTYFKPISIHNAQIENDLNNYYDRIDKYHINNEESTYAQMLGELKYNPVTTLTEQFVNDYLTKNKNKIDVSKVESAIEETRAVYDELMPRINEALIANGYKPIEYRQGYFPHFIEDKAGSVIGKFAEKLGFKVDKGQLPTDIAGITEEFVPGKAWTSFSQQRTGDATDYNLLKGLDNYLRGAMDIIYHTQDIQKLRALEAQMRYEYTDKGVQEKIDEIFNNQELSNEEKYAQAALIVDNQKNNPLGNLVTELRNYTNSLANKKSISDRGMEQTMGRDMYSIMNNISSRVSANMVGANISSAMTNFIPITQAWSQVKTKNMLKAIYATIKSNIRDDGFSDNSIYLTNRTKQADRLFKTKLDKATQKLGIPFEAIDSFTSNVIVRAKYYENLENGMNEVEAMDNADEFAKDVMAGRSKGDSPTMFNKKNPITKLFTAFQLEVNNQYGYMFKDIKADIGKEAKDKIAMAFLKMFLGAFIYNQITEKITGRKAAFSPIDMAIDEAKIITNDNMDLATKLQNIAKDVAEEAPFLGGVLGGGRLPIQGAIPYGDPLSMITSTWENIGALADDEKRDAAINSLKKEWLKPVYYVALPVAGGQIKKTNEGLAMYNHELPGSYTDSGRLRFEADTSPLGKLQAAVFGQYASGNAREYFDEGYAPLTENQVDEAMEANLPITEYREIKKGLTKATKVAKKEGTSQAEAKVDYIYNLPLNDDQKNVLVNNALDRKEDIDISNYGDYSSLEEFDYANKNPQKYDTIRQVANYNVYNVYKDNIQKIKQEHAYTSTRRKAVEDYINSLPLNYYQKLILQKEAAGYSIEKYEVELYNYINGLDISAKEKKNIHKELFG